MTVLIALIAGILVLGLLVFVHELGHFITAKATGVQVDEFGIGFPPRLWAFKRGETTYSLNWIFLGGFVKMLGEEDPTHPRSFASKSKRVRLLILSAGSAMNILLPLILFSIAFMIPQQVVEGQLVVREVAPDSPAQGAGVEVGDTILSIAGHQTQNLNDISYYLHLNLGKSIPVELSGPGGERTVTLTPRWNPPEGQGPTGTTIELRDAHIVSQSYSPWEAVPLGARTTWETMVLMKNEVTTWFLGNAPDAGDVRGPVGIFQLTGEVVRAGVDAVLRWTAFLSINLGIINMLPIPALDGGRVALIALEVIRRGKRLSPKREMMINMIGFALLITLIIVVSFFDISRVIRGESVLP